MTNIIRKKYDINTFIILFIYIFSANYLFTMGTVQITLSKKDIMATKTYKGLNKMMQVFAIKRNNLKIIEHGVNVAKNIGFDLWENQSNYNWYNKEIVKEIVEII